MDDDLLLTGLSQVLTHMDDPVAVLDVDGRLVWANPAFGHLFDLDLAGFSALDAERQWAVFDPSPVHLAEVVAAIAAGREADREGELGVSGRAFVISCSLRPLATAEGDPMGGILFLRDRTRARDVADRLHLRRLELVLLADLARRALDQEAPDALAPVLPQLKVLGDVDVVAHLEVRGDQLHPRAVEGAAIAGPVPLRDWTWCARAVAEGRRVEVADALADPSLDGAERAALGLRRGLAVPVVGEGGAVVAVLLAGSRCSAPADGLGELLAVVADVVGAAAERAALAESRRRLLVTDSSSGLGNARALEAAVTAILDEGQHAAVVLVRLRAFDDVHTAYGPAVAERFVRACADVLAAAVGSAAMRVGTAELGAVVRGSGGERLGDRVWELLSPPVAVDDRLRVLADPAVGTAAATASSSAASVLRRARTALVEACRAVPPVAAAQPDGLAGRSAAHLQRALALDEVIAAQGVRVALQPGRRLTSRAPRWAEALVRFDHPALRGVPVARLVEETERTGGIGLLGDAVAGRAAALEADLRRRGQPLDMLSINVSPLQLGDPDLPARLEALVRAGGSVPGRIALELTETAVQLDHGRARDAFHALRARGFPVMIDDFGAGSSSLGRLADLPVDGLKLDRSLLRGVHEDGRRRAVLAACVDLARSVCHLVIGEGAEQERDGELLAELGVDLVQGWWVAPAAPPAAALADHSWDVWRPAHRDGGSLHGVRRLPA